MRLSEGSVASWRCKKKADERDNKTQAGKKKRISIGAGDIKQHAAQPRAKSATKAHSCSDDATEEPEVSAIKDVCYADENADRKKPCANTE